MCLLRRHGAVIVGATISEAVRRSISCDANARLQLQSMPLGPVSFLTEVEIAFRVNGGSRDSERGWDMWKKAALEKVRAGK